MNAYIKLKKDFDHLQKRTWQLFEIGQKNEGRLKGVLTSVWHELGRISKLDDINEMKERLSVVRDLIECDFAANQALDSDAKKTAQVS